MRFPAPRIALIATAICVIAIGGGSTCAQEGTPRFMNGEGVWNWVDQFDRPGLGYESWGRPIIDRLPVAGDSECWYDAGFLARSYFINDQRIEFTGLESTFAVEGVFRGEIARTCGDALGIIYGELFLNQPFASNVLKDTPIRASFAHNFDQPTVEISQLALVAAHGDLELELGRFVTPFGRFYGFSSQNGFFGTPFIRSEAIGFRETGAQLRWNPQSFRTVLAITNGGPHTDGNSSKAVIARVGVDGERSSVGSSVKWQDGNGSEGQKEFNNHVGVDWMFRVTPSMLISGEVIYDEYGLRRPGVTLDEIDWGRSLYNRQINKGLYQPFSGWGYYANVVGNRPRFDWSIGYGQYVPDPAGDPIHDAPIHRGTGQIIWHLSPFAELISGVVIENSIDSVIHEPRAKGVGYLAGLQARF